MPKIADGCGCLESSRVAISWKYLQVPPVDYPRCPRCQGELPFKRLYAEGETVRGVLIGDGSPSGGILTAGNTGIVCPACGLRLLVIQKRAVGAGVLLPMLGIFILAIGVAMINRRFPDVISRWILAALIAIGFFWFFFLQNYAQRFVQVRPLEDGEHAAFPLSEGN